MSTMDLGVWRSLQPTAAERAWESAWRPSAHNLVAGGIASEPRHGKGSPPVTAAPPATEHLNAPRFDGKQERHAIEQTGDGA